jgi:hypothetical protein
MKATNYIIAFFAVVAAVLLISILRAGDDRMRTFVDLLFIVGGIIMGFGALIYIGISRPSFREWYGHSTGEEGLDRQAEIFLEYRKTQRRQGLLAIVFGLALMLLSAALGIVFL